MLTGTVIFWNPDKGWGFIRSGDDEKIFFYHRDVRCVDLIDEGVTVTFEYVWKPKGSYAVNVGMR